MKTIKFNVLLISALMALTAVAGSKKTSILSLKENITDNDIVFPSSFETDTHEMMKNWYLRNYAEVDANVESKSAAECSDEEYIRRLKAIPSGIELPYNQVVKKYITRYVTKERTMVSQLLGMSTYYTPIFEKALERHGLPLELRNIPIIESAMDPNVVSSAGAAGLWQFMIDTAKDLGLEVNSLVDERRDPYRSSDAAAAYFLQLYNIYKDWSLVIAAYNCGPANVNKALRRAQTKDNPTPDYWAIYNQLPKETRGYVPAFIGATYIMNYYKEHNINPSLAKKPLLIDTVQVRHRVHFDQISQVLNIPLDEIRILNPQYRRDIIPAPTDARGYTLALPSQQIYSYIMLEDSIANYKSEKYGQVEVKEPGETKSVATSKQTTTNSPATTTAQTETSQPESGNKFHKVQRGETLESIAADYGMTPDDLVALNNMNRRHVSRGQVLKVRGSRVATDSPASAATEPASKAAETKSEVASSKKAIEPATTPRRGSYSVDEETRLTNKEREETTTSKRSTKNETSARSSKKNRYDDYSSTKKGRKTKRQQTETRRPSTHTVKAGESLERIAHANGIGTDQLRKANPQLKGDMIHPGDKLNLPKGSSSKKSTTSTKKSKKRRTRK